VHLPVPMHLIMDAAPIKPVRKMDTQSKKIKNIETAYVKIDRNKRTPKTKIILYAGI